MPSVGAGHGAAFAEGRRMREAARTRRPRRQRLGPHRHGSLPRASHRHGPPLPLVLLVIPAVLAGMGALGLTIVGFLLLGVVTVLAMSPMLALGAAVFVNVRRRAALRRGGAAGTAPLPARPAAPARPDLVWARARDRFHRLRGEYAAYECDAIQVLRLPALADVRVPSTARFVDAFAAAQALETDALPPGPHAAGFVSAVDHAERAWTAAREAAERIRLSGLSPAERGTVERVIKLLTTARDSDSDAERLAAYARARSELAKLDHAGVVHVPQAALNAAARSALPA